MQSTEGRLGSGLGLGLGLGLVRVRVGVRVSDPWWIASSAHHQPRVTNPNPNPNPNPNQP